jgi:hypothetical protein
MNKIIIFIKEQVAPNQSSSLLTTILQSAQTSPLFTKIFKTESMYKSY